jgi:hypothetical protein
MKITCSLLLVFMLITLSAYSQSAAKSVYAELGGPGLASLNFDTRFAKTQDGLGMRVGVGGFSISGDGIIFLPLGLNYLIGKDGRNYFELGAGVTPIFASGNAVSNGDPFQSSFGHLNIGYRLQPKRSGVLFRASINPVFGKGFFWPYYAGFAIGYKF